MTNTPLNPDELLKYLQENNMLGNLVTERRRPAIGRRGKGSAKKAKIRRKMAKQSRKKNRGK